MSLILTAYRHFHDASPDADIPAESPARRHRLTPFRLPFLITVITAVYGYEVWNRRWLADDGLIVTRTVRQVLAGHGPVFNLGERAEANTSALWTYLVAAAGWITGAHDPAHVAVLLGCVLSPAGLALGLAGTALWHRRLGTTRSLIPAGALVVLALPPFWDFGTAGLETSLVLCWLGGCWCLLCGLTAASGPRRLYATAVVFGLGWLVRPEMALVSVVFGVAGWLLVRPGRRHGLGLTAAGWALPFAYEVFRAGYYGMLVPLPAIAKNAGSSDWSRGWHYLHDFEGPYHLYIGALLLGGAAFLVARRHPPRHLDRTGVVPAVAAVIAGVALTGYVVAIGGDFMHGRMLLPGLFLLLMPLSLLPWSASVAGLCGALGVWAAVCAADLRPAYASDRVPISAAGISDERQYWIDTTHVLHPDRTADFFHGALLHPGPLPAAVLSLSGELDWPSPGAPSPGSPGPPTPRGRPVTLDYADLGGDGARVPLTSVLVDDLGLSYPLAAHAEQDGRGRPGHEKALPEVWALADLTAPDPAWIPPAAVGPAALAAARDALACGAPAEMLHAVRDPLTPARFWDNLVGAFSRTEFVVPADPSAAERQFCGPDPQDGPAGTALRAGAAAGGPAALGLAWFVVSGARSRDRGRRPARR